MNTSEKDSFRMSFLVKDCGTQELAKKAFKECFHRQRTEWEGAQANDQRVNSLSGRVRRRQVVRTNVVTKTRSMRVRVNDIVSFRNFTPQGRQVGIVCRIDKVKVGKEVMKKWFHMLTVTQNRYELVKVPEDFIYPSVIVDKDKAIFSYGAALHCVSSSSSSSHTTLTTDN